MSVAAPTLNGATLTSVAPRGILLVLPVPGLLALVITFVRATI